MTWSALPEHLNTPEKVAAAFPDDKALGTGFIGRIYTWFQKTTKPWTAFGPRATEWWARWREMPRVLFAIRGLGDWRWESTDGSLVVGDESRKIVPISGMYLSAIQYWTKYHIQVQWPMFIAFHYYIDDVPEYPEKACNRRVIYVRIGARRDADKMYWCPSIFIGLQWN